MKENKENNKRKGTWYDNIDWTSVYIKYDGNITKIADFVGCSWNTAKTYCSRLDLGNVVIVVPDFVNKYIVDKVLGEDNWKFIYARDAVGRVHKFVSTTTPTSIKNINILGHRIMNLMAIYTTDQMEQMIHESKSNLTKDTIKDKERFKTKIKLGEDRD